MGLFSGWMGIAFTVGLIICRGLSTVVFYDALNKRVDGDFRATVNSLVSLGTRGLFIVTGPVLGYGVDALGVNSTLLILAVFLAPLLTFVLFFLSRHIRDESEQQVMAKAKAEKSLNA